MSTRQSKYAILIGVNDYHESLGQLKYSARDCMRIKEALISPLLAFDVDQIVVLTDESERQYCPTYTNIHSWLASQLAQCDEDDLVFVFFAGHGRLYEGRTYLLPCDATLETVHVTGISISYIQDLLRRCRARQKVLVLDACHSGAARDVSPMSAVMLSDIEKGEGICTITSCGENELSYESDDKEQGVFSYYLAQALEDWGLVNKDGLLTAHQVYTHVYKKVGNWARSHRCCQKPRRFSAGVGEITLAHIEPSYEKDLTDYEEKILGEIRTEEEKGNLQQAYDLTEQAISQFPLSYPLNKIKRELEEKLSQERIEKARRSVKVRKERVERLISDAKAFDKDGDIDNAITCLEKAIEYPEGKQAVIYLESLKRGDDLTDTKRLAKELKRLFGEARKSTSESPEDAVAAYERILELYPNNTKALEGLTQAREFARIKEIRQITSTALDEYSLESEAFLKSIQSMQHLQSEYRSVGMEEEGNLLEEEIAAVSEKHRAAENLIATLSQISERVGKYKTGRKIEEQILEDKQILQVVSDWMKIKGVGLDLLNQIFPDYCKLCDEVKVWAQEFLDAMAKAKVKWEQALSVYNEERMQDQKAIEEINKQREEEYAQALAKEQERFKLEQERLDREYKKLPFWKRLYTLKACAKKQPVPKSPKVPTTRCIRRKPVLTQYFKVPEIPVVAIEKLHSEIIISLLSEDVVEWALSAKKKGMKRDLSKKRQPKSNEDVRLLLKSYMQKEALVSWLARKNNCEKQAIRDDISVVVKAIINLLAEGGVVEVRIKEFGTFSSDNEQDVLRFSYSPSTAHTSRVLRETIRDAAGLSPMDVTNHLLLLVQLRDFCKSEGPAYINQLGWFEWNKRKLIMKIE